MGPAPAPIYIVLTGGPGGGKTTLIEAVLADPAWHGRVLALPEAVAIVARTGVPAGERLFQRAIVRVQCALEDVLRAALEGEPVRAVLCDRGSLDPLAYWLDRGWPEAEFYACTGMTREAHYARYAAVLHLVTAAAGAPERYRRRPRGETPADALRIDALLGQAWGDHPHYVRVDDAGSSWEHKARAARAWLEAFLD